MCSRQTALATLFVFGPGAVVGLTACSEGHLVEPGAAEGDHCDLQEDCAPGTVCLDQICVTGAGGAGYGGNSGKRCQVDAECALPDLCLGGVCRPPQAGDGEANPPQAGGDGFDDDDPGVPAEEDKDDPDEGDPAEPLPGPAPDPEPDPGGDPAPAPDPGPGDDPPAAPEPDPDPEAGPVACDADRFEPNDALNQATPGRGGMDEQGLTVCDGDTDLYSLELGAGTPFSASVDGAAGLRVELLEADGVTVASRSRANGDGARTGLAAVPAAGDYFLRVTNAPASAPTEYHLQITASAPGEGPVGGEDGGGVGGDPGPPPQDGQCDDDFWEPNDGFARAVPFGPGVYPLLQICDGNPDLFMVELNPGDTLAASIVFDPDEADLDLALHGPLPDAPLIALSDGMLWTEEAEASAAQAGWHYIAVYPYEFVGSAGYLLTLSVTPAGGG